MHLSGQLSDWSINDLLQIMQVTNKTGSLDIEGERRGRVHFREGRVTGAELSGAKGSYLGSDRAAVADILYVLSTIDSGSFAVGAADGPDVKGWPVEEVLVEVEALRSLEGEVVDAGLFEASGVRLVEDIEEPVTISPEDWHVMVTLVRPFTFNHLEAAYGRGAAVRIFHTLHRLGLSLAIVSDEGETEWLDRLAEDVAPGTTEPTWLEHVEPETVAEPEVAVAPAVAVADSDEPTPVPAGIRGVSAPANTTLTDGVYDEIRRLRSRVNEK
jgi:hypothetical protein